MNKRYVCAVPKGGKRQAIKEDKAILEMTNHLQYMTYNALYDVFGFKARRLKRFYENMDLLKDKWNDGIVTSAEMLTYCKNKNIDTLEFVKKIPSSKKICLVGKNTPPTVIPFIESAMLMLITMSIIQLKEIFNFSNPKIEKYLDKIEYYIDSYTRKQPGTNIFYLNDKIIEDLFLDELKLNIRTGEIVE